MFQSPIGTQKTPLWFVVVDKVSRFQSPIGTQKTSPETDIKLLDSLFQSPIGTQKTIHSRSGVPAEPGFQSPIGTQKTVIFDIGTLKVMVVSIPYRYTKNMQRGSFVEFMKTRFNPL